MLILEDVGVFIRRMIALFVTQIRRLDSACNCDDNVGVSLPAGSDRVNTN